MKKLILYLVMISLFSGCSYGSRGMSGEEIYNKVSPSTVEIAAESELVSSLGSGFYIDTQGTVVTNYHVIDGCSQATVTTPDGTSYDVTKILGYSEELDIAILKTTNFKSVPVEIASDVVATGESVYTIGNSLGFLGGTFSEGVVSSASRIVGDVEYIQISAPISSGNSGGPLVNDKGQVIGITSAGFDEGQNLNLAIPIEAINQISRAAPINMSEFFQMSLASTIASGCVGVRMLTIDHEFTANYIYERCKGAKHSAAQIGLDEETIIIDIMKEHSSSQDAGEIQIVEKGDLAYEVDEWCFDDKRKAGDLEIIENANGYTICYIAVIGK
jgi:S1-C subfamily serine protease